MTADISHADCAEVRRIVIEETARIEQAFAQRVAKALVAMRPATDHPADRIFGRGVAVSAGLVLVMAGLDPEHSRTAPDSTGCCRTVPDDPAGEAGHA